MTIENPVPQATKKPFYKRWWFIVPIALIIIAVVFIAAMFWIADKQQKAGTEEAKRQCHEAVINQAKYPGAATIVTTEFDESLTANSNRMANVFGEADFPNGFGTPVRMAYLCPNILITQVGDVELMDDPLIIEKS